MKQAVQRGREHTHTHERDDWYVRLKTEYRGQAKRTKEEKQAVQRERKRTYVFECISCRVPTRRW